MTCKKSKDQRFYQSRCSKFRAELLSRQTPSELKFAKMLQEHEIAFIPQKGFTSQGMTCIVDFYLPKYKLCIELDGGYHFEQEQIKKDENRDYYLTKIRRFAVARIPNKMCECEEIARNIKNGYYKRGQKIQHVSEEMYLI